MLLELLVESDPFETRVALLEDGRAAELDIERPAEQGIVGNIYKGRVQRVLPGIQAAFVDLGLERNAFLHARDLHSSSSLESNSEELSIESQLSEGQELLVQVTKDPQPDKGPRISCQLSFPGRCLVYLPFGSGAGISRKIADEEERNRLHEILATLVEETGGVIARTVGERKPLAVFRADHLYLKKKWAQVQEQADAAAAPALVYAEADLAGRLVRDRMSVEIDRLVIAGESAWRAAVEYLEEVEPELVGRVDYYSGEQGLFDSQGVGRAVEEALRSRVWLRSGGYLVIHPTEALVAIDVNTGRNIGKSDLEQTVVETNLEAVMEVVRQMRLRDLGGIIVVDFIDMELPENRNKVFAALETELRRDRSKTQLLSISEFGLVQITRKRSRPSLRRVLTEVCPRCRGEGCERSILTICLDIRRAALALPVERILSVRAHPEVAAGLCGEYADLISDLGTRSGLQIKITSHPELSREAFELAADEP